ncbi:GT-D fold domain-containing glycosyltransferase [Wenyingzhuangia sp. IMCC45574]
MKPLKCYLLKKKYDLPKEVEPKVMSINDSFSEMVNRFKENKPFYFVRFGDGEFKTLMGHNHRNYVFNPGLAKELQESFTIDHKDYLISLPINYPFDEYWAQGVYKRFNWQDDMVKLMAERSLKFKSLYHNPCIIHCKLVRKPKELKSFLEEQIRPKKKMFIGGASKEDAEKLFGKIDYYVQTPFKSAYEEIDLWWPSVEKYARDVDLIIPSIGSSSNVVATRLWNAGVRCFVVDFGSIIDAVGLKKTRGWIKRQGHKIEKVLPEGALEISLKQRVSFLLKNIRYYIQRQIN